MCEFVSWIELDKEIYFLTTDDLNSSKGRKLKKHLGLQYENDVKGHGAIEWFYDMEGKGKHMECTDFSSPDNFPTEIVNAIKTGKLRGIGVAEGLLTAPAWDEYNKVKDAAWAEYNKVTAPALAEYNKVTAPALAEYNKVKDAALAEYNKVKAPALAEYNKVTAPALAEYNKVKDNKFWDLFEDPQNRNKKWR